MKSPFRIMPARPLALALALACVVGTPRAFAQDDDETSADVQPRRPRAATGELARRPDERRRASAREITLFDTPLRIAGEWEIGHESRINHDLDEDQRRDRGTLEQEFKIEASAALGDAGAVFLQLIANSEFETLRENGPVESFGEIERGQTWVFVSQPAGQPFDLQLGRISLVENRSWWWDDDLDALRLFFGSSDWVLETGVARQWLPVTTAERGVVDAGEDGLTRWFAHAGWAWRRKHTLEAFLLVSRDHSGQPAQGAVIHERRVDESDADLTWIGLRAGGEEKLDGGHRFGYWVDLARLSGTDRVTDFDAAGGNREVADGTSRRSVRAHAWDIGARWSWPGRARPTLWAGWAVGSGDDKDDDRDHAFRQSGLEENKARFGGVKRFRYYGELLRPSLSNLDIRSIGGSLRFWKKSSIDVVVHDYRQREAGEDLAASRITASPGGESRALGQEVDLFAAVRESARAEVLVSLATFRAGSAFGPRSGERAWLGELVLTVNF
ncbi:MAG: alginate export family protein [Rhodocyclaceae bacterium]|nr:alginate export family protein [Rhodocyclaceae bacterium]